MCELYLQPDDRKKCAYTRYFKLIKEISIEESYEKGKIIGKFQ